MEISVQCEHTIWVFTQVQIVRNSEHLFILPPHKMKSVFKLLKYFLEVMSFFAYYELSLKSRKFYTPVRSADSMMLESRSVQ